MAITADKIRALAALSRLELSDEEVASMQQDLSQILAYVEQLQALDVEGIEATTHAIALEMPRREDAPPSRTLARDAALAAAPEHAEGHYQVPRVIEVEEDAT